MTQEQAIEKIKKLLTLSKNESATEGEVFNALKLAQKLMAQFHISEQEVQNDEDEADVTNIVADQDTKSPSSNKKIMAGALAKHYRCMVYTSKYSLHILGMKTDAEIFAQVLEFSYKSFVRLSGIYIKKFEDRKQKTKAKNTYLLGFCQGILKALEENEAEYALVLYVPNAVVKYSESLNLQKGKSSKKLDYSSDAFEQGFKDGRNLMKNKKQELIS